VGDFDKAYTGNWTRELFIIDEVLPRIPIVYKIKSIENDEQLEGIYYTEQLQKVDNKAFPYDSFKVLDETSNRILIKKINSVSLNNSESRWVNKKEFLNLRNQKVAKK
jgi:hypothetical protein